MDLEKKLFGLIVFLIVIYNINALFVLKLKRKWYPIGFVHGVQGWPGGYTDVFLPSFHLCFTEENIMSADYSLIPYI